MMQDIQRICTESDRRGPGLVSRTSPATATGARRCSTPGRTTATSPSSCSILSPALIRKMRLFVLTRRRRRDPYYEVASIHNERGYERVRSALAGSYDIGANQPDIQVVDAD